MAMSKPVKAVSAEFSITGVWAQWLKIGAYTSTLILAKLRMITVHRELKLTSNIVFNFA